MLLFPDMVSPRMFKLTVICLSVLSCCVGFVNADLKDDGYSGEVGELFTDLTEYQSNIATAETKMNTFANETWDRKYAIAIINLYTQPSPFYLTLNAEMRTGYPNDTNNIWRRAGELINRGLDILGPTIHKKVYRGCAKLDNPPVAGKEYLFNHITSTSKTKETAVGFSSCWKGKGKLFVIENVYGVSVKKYSYFKFEREVIIKSTNVFRVKSGPINGTDYVTYNLDGQPDVNSIHVTDNGVKKLCTGNNVSNAVAIVVILYEWIYL